jgi:hypothetical protein
MSNNTLHDFVAGDLALVEHTISQLLSATDLLCLELDHALSSVPAHPYDRLRYEYLEPNTQTISLSDIPDPINFCLSSISCEISAIADKYGDLFDLQVQALTAGRAQEVYSAFAMPSGDSFVIDKQQTARHLQFVDMVNHIPIQMIEEDPILVAKKILTQYTKMY